VLFSRSPAVIGALNKYAPQPSRFMAMSSKLELGEKCDISEDEKRLSESWRGRVRMVSIKLFILFGTLITCFNPACPQMPILPIHDLKVSELLLHRAHHVLAWIVHFYVHTHPSSATIRIPAPLTIPLLQICQQLRLPRILTYSDDVLYNWALKVDTPDSLPTTHSSSCAQPWTKHSSATISPPVASQHTFAKWLSSSKTSGACSWTSAKAVIRRCLAANS
jgi:hypothetical protein